MKVIRRALRQLALLLAGVLFLIGAIRFAPQFWRWLYPLNYRSIIVSEARTHDLDPSLVAAVINVESHWQMNAVSPKGASGLMQLMPETADWIADKAGVESFQQSQLFSPEVNIRLGVWYLADLLQQFGQNSAVAVAAYNGGRGNVEHWLEQDIWDGTLDDADRIPFAETKRYVIKVLEQHRIYSRLYQWPN